MNAYDEPREKIYDQVAIALKAQFRYGLTPAEAVDYLAVQKAGRGTSEWANVRGITHSTVSGNVSSAKEKINVQRLDAEVIERDETMVVRVRDRQDETHELPFSKETRVMGHDNNAVLTLLYEDHSAVNGYYIDEDENEFEATLWFDGEPYNTFQEFDFGDMWGTPEAKADTILWSRDDETHNQTENETEN